MHWWATLDQLIIWALVRPQRIPSRCLSPPVVPPRRAEAHAHEAATSGSTVGPDMEHELSIDDTQVDDVQVTDTPERAAPVGRDGLRPWWLVAAACLLALGTAAVIATVPSMGQPGPHRAKAVAEQPPVTFATSAPATSPPAPVLA